MRLSVPHRTPLQEVATPLTNTYTVTLLPSTTSVLVRMRAIINNIYGKGTWYVIPNHAQFTEYGMCGGTVVVNLREVSVPALASNVVNHY